MMDFIMAHMGWVAFVMSEIIGLVPGLKSSSVFQLIISIMKAAVDAVSGQQPASK